MDLLKFILMKYELSNVQLQYTECINALCFKVLFDLSLKNLTKNSLMFFIEQNSKKKVFYFTHADLH